MKKRTVLFILNIGFDKPGSSIHLFNGIFDSFLENNFNIIIIQRVANKCADFSLHLNEKFKDNDNVKVITVVDKRIAKKSFFKRFVGEILYSKKLKKIYKNIGNVDSIFIESTVILSYYTKPLRKIFNCPIIYNCQDIFPENAAILKIIKKDGFLYKWFSKIQNKGYMMADKIITISQEMKETLINTGVDKEKISFTYNWGTIGEYDKSNDDELMKYVNFNHEKFTVLYAGNIGYAQNVEIILEVAKIINNQDIIFYIVGSGSLESELKKKILEYGLKNVNIFGMVPQKLSINLYSKADLNYISLKSGIIKTAMPSKIPNIIASNKPIIFAGNEDSDLSLIFKDIDGFYSLDNDPIQIANLINKICKERNEYNFKGIYDSHFSMKNSLHYVRIIEKLIDDGKY